MRGLVVIFAAIIGLAVCGEALLRSTATARHKGLNALAASANKDGPAAPTSSSPSSSFKVVSGFDFCSIDFLGCITTSSTFPFLDGYGKYEDCTIEVLHEGQLTAIWFSIEGDDSAEGGPICEFDYVDIGGELFCGENGPTDVDVEVGSTVIWKSDSSGHGDGWKICLGSSTQLAKKREEMKEAVESEDYQDYLQNLKDEKKAAKRREDAEKGIKFWLRDDIDSVHTADYLEELKEDMKEGYDAGVDDAVLKDGEERIKEWEDQIAAEAGTNTGGSSCTGTRTEKNNCENKCTSGNPTNKRDCKSTCDTKSYC